MKDGNFTDPKSGLELIEEVLDFPFDHSDPNSPSFGDVVFGEGFEFKDGPDRWKDVFDRMKEVGGWQSVDVEQLDEDHVIILGADTPTFLRETMERLDKEKF